MKLKSSARAKKVYLLLESRSRAEVEKAIVDYIGALGWAKASPIFVEGGRKEGLILMAVERGQLNSIRAAFEASPLRIKVLRVSGTIKGAES